MTNADAALSALEARIGHAFANRQVARVALTHSSAAPFRAANGNNERLEFLGDRVLGLVIAEMLMEAFPAATEGELSRRLAILVRWETCASVADEIDLAAALRYAGNAEALTRQMLGDACEAVIGAIYLDAGLPAADRFIRRYWQDRLASSLGGRDAKTTLQEWAQGRALPAPTYRIVGRSGPDHAPHFEVEVTIDTLSPCRGDGRSRREAEQAAAAAALARQGLWPEVLHG